ncbi:ubinuclein-1-like isoform X3 [Labeo rohita]|uniref:Ubinuclein-1-like isoform X3 n=1 Tax=Labeo rohita TaxID=84645 RepID=A0A498LDJ1_LABRO|nr:ubinuclein-1-like isoform X3 [Labeo rohita]
MALISHFKENTEKKKPQTLEEVEEDKERDELEALAKKFEAKYGGAGKRKKDRLQDLVDMGFGYDESDSFIDNSEAYDELVPACLTTRYGGFYINSGTLQFRPASDEGEENENDFEDVGFKPKKRKLKQGKDKKAGKKKKEEDMLAKKEEEEVRKSTPPDKSSAKKKKHKKPLSIDKMLKKFHKEKLQQLQMFNTRERDPHALNDIMHEVQEPPISADPLLTLIGSASADDLLQAVKAAEQDFDLDGLLAEPQNVCSPSLEDNGEALIVSVTEKPPTLLPDGLPPTLEQHIKELSQAVKKIEGQNKMEILSSELNSVLLDVEVNSKQLSGKVRSRIFSYLASQLSCSKGTLVKRAKKLHNLQQDEQLRELLKKLENAVARSMPEQITRFQNHCQAHSEARAAKLEAEKEKVIDGSDEEEEERSGKRVFGPRKRFKWNEEIRELLFEIVNLKMIIYDLESPACSSLEEYLKAFLEADVKPLWPKGWMQSRILLIETRKAHGHITGVVARKKPIGTTKMKKVSTATEDSKNNPEIQGPPALKRKRLSVPVSMQPEATLSTTAKTPSNTQTSTTFSTHPSNQNHKEGNHHTSTQRSPVTADGAGSVQMLWTKSAMDSESKRFQAGEKATPKLTLVAPPDGPEGDCPSVMQGVARLLTTTSVGDTPVSMAALVRSLVGTQRFPLLLYRSFRPRTPPQYSRVSYRALPPCMLSRSLGSALAPNFLDSLRPAKELLFLAQHLDLSSTVSRTDLEEGMVKVFYETAADIADLPFGVTGLDKIFSKYEISRDTVLLIRKSKPDKQFEMESSTVKTDLVQFIRLYEMELVTEYNGKTASKILNSAVLNHFLLFVNKTQKGFKKIYNAFETTAEQFRGKVLFVIIDVSEPRNGRIMEYFRVRPEETPLVRMVNLSNNIQYQLPSDQFDPHSLLEFCLTYLDGKAKPKLQSEPIPENWDTQPVKELVGMNFEKVAFNHDKNVIVLFYAPWSSDSRALFPLWEELAEHFSENEDVVVAKIDVTANDVNLPLGEKYPLIKFFPAVYTERVLPYSDKRELKPIITFMKKEIEKAKKDKAKEEKARKKFLDEQKAAEKEEL